MVKVLKASFQKNCIGCELCVAELKRQIGEVGLEDSPIRIFREAKGFKVDIDLGIKEFDIEKIKNICPSLVFTIEEESSEISHELTD